MKKYLLPTQQNRLNILTQLSGLLDQPSSAEHRLTEGAGQPPPGQPRLCVWQAADVQWSGRQLGLVRGHRPGGHTPGAAHWPRHPPGPASPLPGKQGDTRGQEARSVISCLVPIPGRSHAAQGYLNRSQDVKTLSSVPSIANIHLSTRKISFQSFWIY